MVDPLLHLAKQLLEQGACDSAIEWLCSDREGLESERGAARLEYVARLYAALARHADAVSIADRVLERGSMSVALATNIAWTLMRVGRVEDALGWARRAVAIAPDDPQIFSNLLVGTLYSHRPSADDVFATHREWSRRFEGHRSVGGWPPRDRSPHRRLRVGYVSADFRRHPAAVYVFHLLAQHRRTEFEVYAYAQVLERDDYTEIAKGRCDHWCEIGELTGKEAAELIAQDEIDILVDLTGHFAGSRLDVFALRPAPVQVSFPVYPASTGLSSIQYRLTDGVADPPGTSEGLHSEELIRLPRCFACFETIEPPPEPGPSPFERNGFVTFGAFHAAGKIHSELLALWAQTLRRVPRSRLTMHNLSGDHPIVPRELYQPVLDTLERHGVSADRVRFVPGQDTEDHLRTISTADIALDAFPRNGMTTTFECLLMGVPVVTRVGDCHQSRVSESFLHAVDLPELVAADEASYVEAAVRLATEPGRLRELRRGLRRRAETSALMDQEGFARAVEDAYRRAWIRWCEESTP